MSDKILVADAMQRRVLETLLLVSCATLTLGCDPVRTTGQVVRLRVNASARPAVGAQVQLRYDYRQNTPKAAQTQHLQQWWDDMPWHSGVTDSNGEAQVVLIETRLDSSWGSHPPSSANWVTGTLFAVRIVYNDDEEELSVRMQPDASADGEHFSVTIIEIEEPTYRE